MILRTVHYYLADCNIYDTPKKKTCSNNDNNNLYVHMCYYLFVHTYILLLFKLTKDNQ